MLYTDARKKIISKEANIPGYGRVYLDNKAITNLFSLKDLITRGRVQFVSGIQNVFKAQVGKNIMNFIADSKGLYILSKEKPNECHAQVEGFSQSEIVRAKKTSRLYHQLAAPSVTVFKSLLRQNLIRNCEVMEKDIKLTNEFFGPDVPPLKGRSTRPKQRKVVDEQIVIPDEFVERNKNLKLVINIIFINKERIITTIDMSIIFKACVLLPLREIEDIFVAWMKSLGIITNEAIQLRRKGRTWCNS